MFVLKAKDIGFENIYGPFDSMVACREYANKIEEDMDEETAEQCGEDPHGDLDVWPADSEDVSFVGEYFDYEIHELNVPKS